MVKIDCAKSGFGDFDHFRVEGQTLLDQLQDKDFCYDDNPELVGIVTWFLSTGCKLLYRLLYNHLDYSFLNISSVKPGMTLVRDERDRNNQLIIDVHEDLVHKRTFGVSIFGFLIHIYRGKSLYFIYNHVV